MTNLSIGNSAIRQLDGLYSLNDLHAAAGGEAKDEPNRFLRLDQTKALIAEISCSPEMGIIPTKTVRGRGKAQGTYVCRELVYAYANWISPAFYLKMIRAFDAMQQPAIPAASFSLRAVMLEDNSTPSVPLSGEIQSAINKKAWSMAHDAYELCREHLARRVEYTSAEGQPRRINERRALAIIAESSLDTALLPRHHNMLRHVVSIAESMARTARQQYAEMRREIERLNLPA